MNESEPLEAALIWFDTSIPIEFAMQQIAPFLTSVDNIDGQALRIIERYQ